MLSDANTEVANIRVLKAMGNMGAKELISPIKTIIEDRSLPVTVRVEAVFALRKLAKHFDKLVNATIIILIRFQVAPFIYFFHLFPLYPHADNSE